MSQKVFHAVIGSHLIAIGLRIGLKTSTESGVFSNSFTQGQEPLLPNGSKSRLRTRRRGVRRSRRSSILTRQMATSSALNSSSGSWVSTTELPSARTKVKPLLLIRFLKFRGTLKPTRRWFWSSQPRPCVTSRPRHLLASVLKFSSRVLRSGTSQATSLMQTRSPSGPPSTTLKGLKHKGRLSSFDSSKLMKKPFLRLSRRLKEIVPVLTKLAAEVAKTRRQRFRCTSLEW